LRSWKEIELYIFAFCEHGDVGSFFNVEVSAATSRMSPSVEMCANADVKDQVAKDILPDHVSEFGWELHSLAGSLELDGKRSRGAEWRWRVDEELEIAIGKSVECNDRVGKGSVAKDWRVSDDRMRDMEKTT